MLSINFIRRFRYASVPVRRLVLKLSYTRQERAALCGKIPMTLQLFRSCLCKTAAVKDWDAFHTLCGQFPGFLNAFNPAAPIFTTK